MGLSDKNRRQVMIAHEGQILAYVGTFGTEMAGDLARSYADGAINAIIRLEGAEAAAGFAFALSDRAVGGLRGETPVFPLPAIPDEQALIAETERDSALAAVAAALEDDEADDPAAERYVAVRQGLPTWFLYWAMTIGVIAGWIVGRGWPA